MTDTEMLNFLEQSERVHAWTRRDVVIGNVVIPWGTRPFRERLLDGIRAAQDRVVERATKRFEGS